jgi:hypothetical protein
VCCEIVEVGEIDKPAGSLCRHYNNGCTLFNKKERPMVCKSFQCGWLRGFGEEKDRPDKIGLMLSISNFNGGVWIFAIETKEDAINTTGKDIILDIIDKVDIPVIVSDFNTKIGEDYGDYVILKEKLESKASKIKGEHISEYSEGVNMYRLNGRNSII